MKSDERVVEALLRAEVLEMVPAVVLLVSFAVRRSLGFLRVAALDNWNLPVRIALFLMFMVTASAHWGGGLRT